MPWSKVGNMTPPTAPPVVLPAQPYVRPTDWLALPVVNVGDQKVVGLYAVYPYEGTNFVALSCAGAFTVDWGDGTAPENFATNAQANHLYTYATVSASTDTSRGHRQVIVTVTPQAGQTLTVVNLGKKHPQAGLPTNAATGWLDVCMAGASVTTLQLGLDTGATSTVLAIFLEQFEYKGPSAITALNYMFGNCYNLQSLKGSQFTANATSVSGFLLNCNSLKILSDLNLSKVTNGTSLFANNKSLQRVSGLNLAAANPITQMFENCSALVEVTDISAPLASAATSMFNGCTSLRTVSTITAGASASFSTMFNGCSSLRTVTGLTTTSGTTFNQMFASCSSLQTVPLFDTTQGTSLFSMFDSCTSLQRIPLFNTAKGLNFSSMFSNCFALIALPALNMAAATNVSSFVAGCPSLSSVGVVGLKIACTFSTLRLSSAELNALYGQLGTVSGIAITVTGNYGTTADNPSIATAKGWTVTGS